MKTVEKKNNTKQVEMQQQISVLAKLKKWGDYDSVGTPIEDLLIPMKTPLTETLLR